MRKHTEQKQNPAAPGSAPPRPTRKLKVTECGIPEQGEPVEAGEQQSEEPQERLRQQDRDDYRYTGTPLGSDPRE